MTDSFQKRNFTWMTQGETQWRKTFKDILDLQIDESNAWGQFFTGLRKNLVNGHDFDQMIKKDPDFKSFSIEELREKNHLWFSEIRSGEHGYEKCFANPDYAVSVFELKLGQLLSAIYVNFRQCSYLARIGNYSEMFALSEFFIELFELYQKDQANYENIYSAYKRNLFNDFEKSSLAKNYIKYDPTFDLYYDLIKTSEFSDLRYLYRFGLYVDPQIVKLAEFLNNYPHEELVTIAKNHVAAYLKSFNHKKLDYRKKKYAKVHYPQGMEKLAFLYGEELKKVGLIPAFGSPDTQGANEQYSYDSRFQNALYLDQDFVNKYNEIYAKALNEMKENLRMISGSVVIWLFGQEPFVPTIKTTTIQMNAEQDKLMHSMQNKLSGLYFEAAPRGETSFSVISFPSTEIGPKFEEIFKDTVDLNNLDGDRYEEMQEHMIDILDQSEYVEVKGKEGNKTNICVQLPKLVDPKTQTNFFNCGADVNIPVGEIFTSPKLTGTNGVLHVDDIFLFGFRYYNLEISFQDGMITDYTCTNFDSEEENKKYMFDNLLKPNKTLPIGEFAIGTNTLAYQMAQKHQIQHLLPILIAEKMGPHFAIGDTCFAHEEESYQTGVISGKLMVATENEKSALRKTDPSQAYTHKHVDITLPYDMLAEITAVKSDGTRVPIILDGLFVVPGTEELNIPLKEMRES